MKLRHKIGPHGKNCMICYPWQGVLNWRKKKLKLQMLEAKKDIQNMGSQSGYDAGLRDCKEVIGE